MSQKRNLSQNSTLEVTESGTSRISEVTQEFDRLIWAAALQNGRRRGSNCLDNTDIDAAYEQLIGPRGRPQKIEIIAEFGLIATGGLVSYSITLLTQSPPKTGPGLVLLSTGLFLGVFSSVIKHVKNN